MTKVTEIPKKLAPRSPLVYSQKIPKIIWQTMKTNKVPDFMNTYARTWMDLNPEYVYRFHDDDDVIEFITTSFPEYLEEYSKLTYGASKADLWRYLIMYKYGGVYADMDCKCINPLRNWVSSDALFVTQLGTNKDICQWLIITVPGNPIFLRAAQKTLQNSKYNNCKESYHGFELSDNNLKIRNNEPLIKFDHEILGLSGPPVLQKAAEECKQEGIINDIISFTQVVCVSDKTSCHMAGNVAHDAGDEEYKKAYKSLNLKHYNNRIERIKRKFINLLNLN